MIESRVGNAAMENNPKYKIVFQQFVVAHDNSYQFYNRLRKRYVMLIACLLLLVLILVTVLFANQSKIDMSLYPILRQIFMSSVFIRLEVMRRAGMERFQDICYKEKENGWPHPPTAERKARPYSKLQGAGRRQQKGDMA